MRVLAFISATGLVVASAGFGAVYAWTIGSQHSMYLAILTVVFAVALELSKPLAIASRNPLLWLLGLVAIGYSLTAELALMAGNKGDLIAKREHSSDAYVRARQELATLKPSRSVEELEPIVANAREHCRISVTLRSGRQTICSKSPSLLAEYGRAKRRAELETVLAGVPDTGTADPGATALVTYFAAAGYDFQLGAVSQWLNLVPVLALELGSALSGLLLKSLRQPKATPEKLASTTEAPPATVLEPVEKPTLALPSREALERDRVSQAILSHLRASNGAPLATSHRALASLLEADRNTVGRALDTLSDRGLVSVASTKAGTVVRLVS